METVVIVAVVLFILYWMSRSGLVRGWLGVGQKHKRSRFVQDVSCRLEDLFSWRDKLRVFLKGEQDLVRELERRIEVLERAADVPGAVQSSVVPAIVNPVPASQAPKQKTSQSKAAPVSGVLLDDLTSALKFLGYKAVIAKSVAKMTIADHPGMELSDLIQAALQNVGKSP